LKARILVIGIDGATSDLLMPWIEDGLLPTLRKLVSEGAVGTLKSTIPPYTPLAWSSIYTGRNPGKHGIFDFMKRAANTYQMVPTNASFRKGRDVWQIVSESKKKVLVVNAPFSYPPRPVNGCMITGMMTPPGNQLTYPDSLKDELHKKCGKYKVHLQKVAAKGREQRFLDEHYADSKQIAETVVHLIKEVNPDLTFAVFFGSDQVQHIFWATTEPTHRDHGKLFRKGFGPSTILDFYKDLDQRIEKIIDAYSNVSGIIVVSDHGFGTLRKWIHINEFLIRAGFLSFKNSPMTTAKMVLRKLGITPRKVMHNLQWLGLARFKQLTTDSTRIGILRKFFLSLDDVDWSCTQAYAPGPLGSIYLNRKGREPHGIIESDAEYQEIRKRIAQLLRAQRDPETRERIFERVLYGEEVYFGTESAAGPDIVVLPAKGYSPLPAYSFESTELFSRSDLETGAHRPNGICIIWGRNIRPNHRLAESYTVEDIAPTILYLMGLSLPSEMDGRVITEAFVPEWIAANPPSITNENSKAADDAPSTYTKDEEDAIRERLRRLGYL
jgi:predicted AlkP superfamily phosphohydrolase/phosphomutase